MYYSFYVGNRWKRGFAWWQFRFRQVFLHCLELTDKSSINHTLHIACTTVMIRFQYTFLQVARDHKSVITFTHTTQRMLRHVQQMSNAHIFTMCWCSIDHNVTLRLWHLQWRDVFLIAISYVATSLFFWFAGEWNKLLTLCTESFCIVTQALLFHFYFGTQNMYMYEVTGKCRTCLWTSKTFKRLCVLCNACTYSYVPSWRSKNLP